MPKSTFVDSNYYITKKKGLRYLFTLFAAKPIFFRKIFQPICFSIF